MSKITINELTKNLKLKSQNLKLEKESRK